jgi:hypothetical protein
MTTKIKPIIRRWLLVRLIWMYSVGSMFSTWAFHDCVEASARVRQKRQRLFGLLQELPSFECAGGVCVGMTNGPHEGGNASYPVAWNGITGTRVHSTMTVPQLPAELNGITYYLWTDVFFGDASLGRMNQFVPQLLLGDVLDGSSGPPGYEPLWGHHDTWVFGAHYFFETFNTTSNQTDAHASYGKLYPTWAGETLFTIFELIQQQTNGAVSASPRWILTMGVVGDDTRVSRLVVDQPYMGLGERWQEPTASWLEPSYKNMCINACWEIYGAPDAAHLPSSGAHYNLTVLPPSPNLYPFTSWERDEGNGICPACTVSETHSDREQTVLIDIGVSSKESSLRMETSAK